MVLAMTKRFWFSITLYPNVDNSHYVCDHDIAPDYLMTAGLRLCCGSVPVLALSIIATSLECAAKIK